MTIIYFQYHNLRKIIYWAKHICICNLKMLFLDECVWSNYREITVRKKLSSWPWCIINCPERGTCGWRSSNEYCMRILERIIRRVMRFSEAELRSRWKFLFIRYCRKAVWMVRAARLLRKEPPYFFSNISTWQRQREQSGYFLSSLHLKMSKKDIIY